PVPPRPTCTPLFNSGSCADLWRNYNQALQQHNLQVAQQYITRQKELAATEASAPLQQQIADLNKLVTDQQAQVKKMQEQMQTDATAALQAKSAAPTQGLEYGTGIGVASTLVLFAVIFGIKRAMSNFTVTKKPQTQSTAAGK